MTKKLVSTRLVLNTSLFYPQSTGAISGVGPQDTRLGYADAGRLNCIFTNLDWILILGNLYDKYSTFSFNIESIVYLSSGGTAFASPQFVINVNAQGLDWVDQNYDVVNKVKGVGATIYIGPVGGCNVNQIDGLIFRKPNTRFGDITLTITNAMTGTQAGAYDRPCALAYVIKIFGVDEV